MGNVVDGAVGGVFRAGDVAYEQTGVREKIVGGGKVEGEGGKEGEGEGK